MAFTANAQTIKHPSLLFTPDRVKAAMKRCDTDTAQASAWHSILERADAELERSDVRSLQYPALAYQATGERKYANKVVDILKSTAKVDSWADAEMMMRNPAWRSELQMAHRAFQLAVGYDAVYDCLTPTERKEIAQGLWCLAVEPLLGDWILEPTRIHSLNSMGHNWWSSCVGMGGLLALAISNELPEAREAAQRAVELLPEWFDFAGDQVQRKSRSFDRDGGMYESINYASFGITEALLLRMAWLNSHPGAKLESLPQMAQLSDFFCHVAYPRTGMLYSINFGDSHKNVTGESSMLLAYAMGEENPNTLWYVNQLEPGQHWEGFPRHYPMGFLYTPDLNKAPVTPTLPKEQLWEDFGWATMRDSWAPDATMLAVKCGATWNHAHADAASLILFHKGVDIIKDAGNCSYGKPEYRNYFFQSDAHNVVKFNGKGQSAYQQYHGTLLPGSLSGIVAGDRMRYLMADATGPTADNFARNQRHYLWVGSVLLVIDDLKTHEAGQFEWLWHPGGETRKVGGDLVVTNGDASAIIRPLYPQPLAPSNYVHDYPEMLYWDVLQGPTEDLRGTEDYYSLKLPGQHDRIKAVTAIILKDSPDQRDLPTIEKREGKDWIGLRITEGGKVTDVYINQLADGRLMHLNSWIEADGWSTDAYLLAISPDEQLIVYGSALRRDGLTHFSSLSKLNLLAERSGTALSLHATGQPRLHFSLCPSSRPSTLTLNGTPTPITLSDGLITIKK